MYFPRSYPVQLVAFHFRNFDANYDYPRHHQPYHQLYITLEGKVIYEADGIDLKLDANSGVWVAPGCRRAPRAGSRKGRYLVATFVIHGEDFPAPNIERVTLSEDSLEDIDAFRTAAESGADGGILQFLFNRIFFRLRPRLFSRSGPASGMRLDHDKRIVDTVEKLMSANLSDPLSLKELCRLSHTSQATLGRAFRHCLSMAPMTHYRNLRLERAKELLLSGNCTISEAAFATGFSSSQHLAGACRQYFRSSPSGLIRIYTQSNKS